MSNPAPADDPRPYRQGIGIVLFNIANQVFVGERIDSPGSWQMPQGGIDDGESAEIAFFREMREEIGTEKATIIHVMEKKLRYELPHELSSKLWEGKYRGQEQTWIAGRFTGNDADIHLALHQPPEFERWQWVDLDHLLDLIVPFKRETYREVIHEFKKFTI